MIIYRNFSEAKESYTACIGFFDGVHLGHRFLLEDLKNKAHAAGNKSAVITFANHPRQLVQPDFDLKLVHTLRERLEALAETGIDVCFLLNFTEEVRQLSARQFLEKIIAQKMHVRQLLVGYDHRFGHNREEGFDDYVRYGQECGIEVLQEPVFKDKGLDNVSSSEVRRSLTNGDIVKANQLLGKPYELEGEVIAGHQLGRTIGFPTANMEPRHKEKIIPSVGVYAVQVRLQDDSIYPAMLNIGYRPTITELDKKITLEVHLIGFEGNLYGQNITISFVERMRDEKKMSSLDDLKQQLDNDKRQAEAIIRRKN